MGRGRLLVAALAVAPGGCATAELTPCTAGLLSLAELRATAAWAAVGPVQEVRVVETIRLSDLAVEEGSARVAPARPVAGQPPAVVEFAYAVSGDRFHDQEAAPRRGERYVVWPAPDGEVLGEPEHCFLRK